MPILIVEPKISLRRAIRNTLERAGFVALVESYGSEDAMNRLDRLKPDVFIIGRDLGTHDATGFSSEIRRREEYQQTPILLVTARTTHEDILEVVEAGVDACILIPINENILVEKTRKALERAARIAEAKKVERPKSRFQHRALVMEVPQIPRS